MADPRKQTEIGEIPESWQVVRLGALLSLSSGKQRPDDLTLTPTEDRPFPVYGGNGGMGYSSRYSVETPTLVIGRVGVYSGCVHTTSGKGWITDNALFQRDPLPGTVSLGFLAEALRMINLGSVRRAGAQPLVTQGEILQLSIALPPLDEQAAIAAVVEPMRARAGQERAICQKLADLRSETMAKLFREGVRGEPVRQLNYGEAPESWKVALLGEVAEIQTGVTKGRQLDNTDVIEVPYLRVANVQDGHLDLSEMKTIEIRRAELERYLLRESDVVLTEGGDFDKLGRGFIWRSELPLCIHQNHVFAVRTDRTVLLPEFFAYLAQSPYGKAYFLQVAHKTTNLSCINSTKLKAFPIVLPGLEEQEQIVSILGALDQKFQVQQRGRVLLENLLQSLVQQLMTGAIRVNEFNGAEVSNA